VKICAACRYDRGENHLYLTATCWEHRMTMGCINWSEEEK
jgi:hypothetical protein